MMPLQNLLTKIILKTATAEDFFAVCGESFNTLYNIFFSSDINRILNDMAGITIVTNPRRIRFRERNWIDVRYEIYGPGADIIEYIKHGSEYIYYRE